MSKPNISIYVEQKPAHYVGADISITVCHKENVYVDAVVQLIEATLLGSEYEIKEKP